MSSGAFMAAADVFNWAVEGLCFINAIRQAEDEDNLARASRPRLFGLLRPRTREEADKYLRSSDPYGWHYPSERGMCEYKILERLGVVAARLLSDPNPVDERRMFVTTDDHEVLTRNAGAWRDRTGDKDA